MTQNTCKQSYYRISEREGAPSRPHGELFVRCCGESQIKSRFYREYPQNSEYELIYILSGTMTVTVGDKEYRMQKGDVICRKEERFFFSIRTQEPMEEPVRYYWVHFESESADETIAACGLTPDVPFSVSGSEELMEEYERLFFEFRVRHQSFDFACSVSVKRILLMLGRMKGGDPLGILDRSLKYIHARLRHKISVGELAALEYLGESRYRELFRRETGMSPSEYIEAQRTERAKDMLDGGDMTVAEVALAVGYTDPHYFQRVFKKREGMTPGEYRKLLEKPRKRQ